LRKLKSKPSARNQPSDDPIPINPVPEGFQLRMKRQIKLVEELSSEKTLARNLVLTQNFESKMNEYKILLRMNGEGAIRSLERVLVDLDEFEASVDVDRITRIIYDTNEIYFSRLGIQYRNELPTQEKQKLLRKLNTLVAEERRLRSFIADSQKSLVEG